MWFVIWFTGGAGIRVNRNDSSGYKPEAEDVPEYSVWLADVNVASFDTCISCDYIGIQYKGEMDSIVNNTQL